MNARFPIRYVLATLLVAATAYAASPAGMARIPGGGYTPPFRDDSTALQIKVASFWLDTRAVTTAEFFAFVRENPRYARSRIPGLLADTGYLRDWQGDLQPAALSLNSPVTAVSWYAAKQYCSARGKRLPTTTEWEFTAATTTPGVDRKAHQAAILRWYGRSAAEGPPVTGSGTRHARGVNDLHGVVWEWTSDYNAWSGGGVNKRGVKDEGLFCGGAAARAVPDTDYATYMRWAFRASLKPEYTVSSLGFRCALDEDRKEIKK